MVQDTVQQTCVPSHLRMTYAKAIVWQREKMLVENQYDRVCLAELKRKSIKNCSGELM
jgi:hypothetical protein